MSNYAEVHGGYEFHLVGVDLFITEQQNPDVQVKLGYEAIEGMLSYLCEVGVIAGRVKYVEEGQGGAHIYRLILDDRLHLGETAVLGLLVNEGDVEIVETAEYFMRPAAQDKKNGTGDAHEENKDAQGKHSSFDYGS